MGELGADASVSFRTFPNCIRGRVIGFRNSVLNVYTVREGRVLNGGKSGSDTVCVWSPGIPLILPRPCHRVCIGISGHKSTFNMKKKKKVGGCFSANLKKPGPVFLNSEC